MGGGGVELVVGSIVLGGACVHALGCSASSRPCAISHGSSLVAGLAATGFRPLCPCEGEAGDSETPAKMCAFARVISISAMRSRCERCRWISWGAPPCDVAIDLSSGAAARDHDEQQVSRGRDAVRGGKIQGRAPRDLPRAPSTSRPLFAAGFISEPPGGFISEPPCLPTPSGPTSLSAT